MMKFHNVSFLLLLILLLGIGTIGCTPRPIETPLATEAPQTAATIIATDYAGVPGDSLDQVDRKVLTPVDSDALLKEDAERDKDPEYPGPMRYAIIEKVSFNLENSGTWESVEGGEMWRLRIHTPGAFSHSLGITRFDLPEGATLNIYDLEQSQMQGPYTAAHRSNKGRLWTAIIESDEIVVELFVQSRSAETVLEITEISQGYRSFGKGGGEKSGDCNNDVICPVGDPWRDQIRSVARYTIENRYVCSGQLINNTSVDFTPYFLSAHHCGVTSQNDDTLVFYWNFESPNCGDLSGGSLADNQTGSIFRASYAASDFLLVELSATPSASSNVFHTGWDRTGDAPNASVGIHHPSGDEKAISFNNNAVTSTNYYSSNVNAASNHWRVDDWEDGTTEGGSSGSCLWDAASGLCVGQLHGGNASCASITDDWYGKFSVSWAGGNTNETRLSNWLDPGNTGVSILNGDPHITTFDGTRYDFQGAGEFVALRDADGSEIQVRQTPISTTFTPGANPYHGLATCVSLNTAVAVRVGKFRISYQPNLSGEPDPRGLQLRINGDLTTLEEPIDLGNGGSITRTDVQGGIYIDFPDKYVLIVTPGWWESQSTWYLNVSIVRKSVHTVAGASLSDGSLRTGGLNAPITEGNWLPALPDGTNMGPMPTSLNDRYVGLYEAFGAAWRVSDTTSLFDYAPGTSTADFTLESWPGDGGNCELPDVEPVEPLDLDVAQQLCEEIPDRGTREDCVFDVMVTGEPGFAETYLQSLRNVYGENCKPGRAGVLPSWCKEQDKEQDRD